MLWEGSISNNNTYIIFNGKSSMSTSNSSIVNTYRWIWKTSN